MDSEHDQILREYNDFFTNIQKTPTSLLITTKESTQIIAEWTTSGWLLNDTPFETFESGMMSLSPSFTQRFHQELTRKLILLGTDETRESPRD